MSDDAATYLFVVRGTARTGLTAQSWTIVTKNAKGVDVYEQPLVRLDFATS